MKDVILIYVSIPETKFNTMIKYLLTSNQDFRFSDGYYYGLYAWTTNKSIYKEFIENRNRNIYRVEKVEFLDKSEFKEFKLNNIESMLDYRNYSYMSADNKTKNVTIVSTKNEFIQSTENSSENMMEFGPKNIVNIDYSIFKEEIIDALDKLGYTTDFDLNSGLSDESRSDNASFQLSYGLTVFGNKVMINGNNEINILLYLFHFFFFGDE